MVCAPGGALAKAGLKTTRDLYTGDNPLAVLRVNKHTGVPECFLVPVNYAGAPNAVRHCPFLLWDENPITRKEAAFLTSGDLPGPGSFWLSNGAPKFKCALGPAAPIQCLNFPMGRGATVDGDGVLKWFPFCTIETCEQCMPTTIKPDGTGEGVHEWVSRPEITAMQTYSDDYVRIQTAMYKMNLPTETAIMIAMTMFDFDGFMLDQGVPIDEINDKRPITPGEAMMAAEQMIKAMVPVTEDGKIIEVPNGPH
jgi:hypothetical protein